MFSLDLAVPEDPFSIQGETSVGKLFSNRYPVKGRTLGVRKFGKDVKFASYGLKYYVS